MHIWIYLYVYYTYNVFVQFRPLYFWIWVSICFERCQSRQNLPQKLLPHHLRRCNVAGKRGERQRFGEQTTCKPLDLPSGWPILPCSHRHANFQTSANPRMFKYIDVLVLAAEILGTIVWHICFHETSHPGTRIKIERTLFSHVSLHNKERL